MIDRTEMIIGPETAGDHAAIRDVVRAAFGSSVEADLVDALRNLPEFDPRLSLVAEFDGEIHGHLLFSLIRIETGKGGIAALALAPLAVHPESQRQGIGSELTRAGLRVCEQLGHRIVIVVGHPTFYARFGLIPASRWGVRPPFPIPDDVFMVKWLGSEPPSDFAGVVRYSAPFGEL